MARLRPYLAPLTLGVFGTVVLMSLGIWQVQRLAWKETVLGEIAAQISAPPVVLPANPNEERHQFLPVFLEGVIGERELAVLVSRRDTGAGFRIIARYDTDDGRAVLLDRGFVPDARKGEVRPGGEVRIIGNLHWPDEIDSYTPPPDRGAGIWFARDIPAMAAELGTEPVLVVQSEPVAMPGAPRPFPVDTAHIRNDHLQYAGTWFLLALSWAGMTLYWLLRIRRAGRG